MRRRDSGPRAQTAEPTTAFECCAPLAADELSEGTWIVLLRADRIPHVALLQDGVYHSLEHDGFHCRSAAELWRLIRARAVPSVLCRLRAAPATRARPFFERHGGLDGDVDCFVPVRDYCASWFPAAAACDYAYELLPLLASTGALDKAGSLHLPALRPGVPFELPRYTRAEIRARIEHVRTSGAAAGRGARA